MTRTRTVGMAWVLASGLAAPAAAQPAPDEVLRLDRPEHDDHQRPVAGRDDHQVP